MENSKKLKKSLKNLNNNENRKNFNSTQKFKEVSKSTSKNNFIEEEKSNNDYF